MSPDFSVVISTTSAVRKRDMSEGLSTSASVSVSECATESCCPVEKYPPSVGANSEVDTGGKTVNPKNPDTRENSQVNSSVHHLTSTNQSESSSQDAEVKSKSSNRVASAGAGGRSSQEGGTGRKVCSFFQKTGWCRFGSRCRYLHSNPVSSKPKDDIQLSESEQVVQQPISAAEVDIGKNAKKKETGDAAASQRGQGVCKFFARSGWCRYGVRCRFAHVSEKKSAGDGAPQPKAEKKNLNYADSDEPLAESVAQLSVEDAHHQQPEKNVVPKKPCRYFARGQCRMGQRCAFLHETDQSLQGQDDVQSNEKDPSEGEWRQAKKPSGAGPLTSRPIAELQDGELEQMRETEISQLQRRFPGDKLKVVKEGDDTHYVFTVNPSDPDWPYDLKDFELQVSFPAHYPVLPMQLKLPEEQVLPSVILRHISPFIDEWITARHATNQLSGRVELMMRPFLRWFDRNLMRLFTEGARLFKKQVYAKAAGFEFVSFSQGDKSADPKSASLSTDTTDGQEVGEHAGHERKELGDVDGRNSEDNGEDDEEEGEEDDDEDDDGEDGGISEDDDEEEEEEEEEAHEGDDNADSKVEDKVEAAAVASSPLHALPAKLSSMYESPTENRRGTEIQLRNMQMSEDAATLSCQKIKLCIQCSRCKTQSDISVLPKQAMIIGCSKCQGQQAVSFRPCLVHAFSPVLGFLDITGCAPVDLIIFDCSFTVMCLSCSSDTKVQGVQYGQKRMIWCSSCHQKMSIGVDSAKFLRLVATVPEGRTQVVAVKKEKKVKDPAIKEGFPLPNNGACKHYKKSFRWLRFPCCGKCYPCDECHDLEQADHEMKYATRMICGFCSKEQPYSRDKPCIACSASTTKGTTQHWEGGTGCRNRTKMSKNDKQKYSNLSKTTSRRSKKVEDQRKGKRK